MNRRQFVTGASVLALASAVRAAPTSKSPKTAATGSSEDALAGVADAASDCIRRAEACLQHCLVMLGGGDSSMAACAQTVRDTLASSRALESLATAGSKHARAMAKVASDTARDCEAECRKHAQHPTCKACGDACTKLIAEITKLPA